ncbi:MAG: hypothetical protein V3V33_10170 [Candidatus Lokiarchaeia archaeon]
MENKQDNDSSKKLSQIMQQIALGSNGYGLGEISEVKPNSSKGLIPILNPKLENEPRIYILLEEADKSPHHFHVRGMQSVVDSPMRGEPNHDIPILLKYILDSIKK